MCMGSSPPRPQPLPPPPPPPPPPAAPPPPVVAAEGIVAEAGQSVRRERSLARGRAASILTRGSGGGLGSLATGQGSGKRLLGQ